MFSSSNKPKIFPSMTEQGQEQTTQEQEQKDVQQDAVKET